MNSLLEIAMPWIEFASKISGILTLLGLIIGVQQLRLFRLDSRSRVMREAATLSISILEKKTKELCDLHLKILVEQDSLGIRMPAVPANEDFVCDPKENGDWRTVINSDAAANLWNLVIDFLNEMEGLASYINEGIANDEMCYRLDGKLIIEWINEYRNYIALYREDNSEDTYKGIIQLFKRWSQFKAHEDLQKKRKSIDEEIKKSPKSRPISVFGRI